MLVPPREQLFVVTVSVVPGGTQLSWLASTHSIRSSKQTRGQWTDERRSKARSPPCQSSGCSSLLTVLLEPRIPRETMSIADADAKAAMPAGDTAPEVGSKLKANMSQPIRKGVAKWTDTVRKMAVRSPREPAPCAQTPRRRVAAPCAGPRRCAAPRFGQLDADGAVGERVGG